MRRSHKEVAELIDARAQDFFAGVITETVFEASLFALGLRGEDLRLTVKEYKQIKFDRTAK